jgi:mannose-1-phosphate guanylyltransferase / mannose-6-phosphate isomerase
MLPIFPIILSGGSGTRLWPLSRAMYPKQFTCFSDTQSLSFLAATLQRLAEQPGVAPPVIVCNNDHRFLVADEAERAGVAPRAIVLEPVARNTGPAVAVAALLLARDNPAAVLAVMPSDHMIRDAAAFAGAVRRAAEVAATGKIVLFGITPDRPHIGYGYIRRGSPLAGFAGAYTVAAFTEKPDLAKAEGYLAAGDYFWNSGIFVFGARAFLDELARLDPAILTACTAALGAAKEDLGFLRLDREAFARAPSISIDYAVMERTAAAAVLPIDIGWSDVGSWSALWELAARDRQGNAVHGDAMLQDTTGSYVHAGKGLVATLGVKDLVIVNTPDALLVADRAKAEDVGSIVARLKQAKRSEHAQHTRSYRPWGFFETLSSGPRFQVKLLHVRPGAKLSLQMHHHRSEHWVVVQGTAKVLIGEEQRLVRENESVYIVATQWHRLENPGKTALELIEVQIGGYLGEDDIVRCEDVYNRTAEETR